MAYKNLVDQDQLTPDNLRKAQYLGWCVEMVSVKCMNYTIVDSHFTEFAERYI